MDEKNQSSMDDADLEILSYEQAAAILNISVRTLRSWVAKANRADGFSLICGKFTRPKLKQLLETLGKFKGLE